MFIPLPNTIKIPPIKIKSIKLAPKIFPKLNEGVFCNAEEIPTKNQKIYNKIVTLNDYIPFNHTFERIDGENYKAVFNKIMKS
jgi:hypothetical protein